MIEYVKKTFETYIGSRNRTSIVKKESVHLFTVYRLYNTKASLSRAHYIQRVANLIRNRNGSHQLLFNKVAFSDSLISLEQMGKNDDIEVFILLADRVRYRQ
jgi:hypothetical protein